jgi:hypothetical protein
MPITLEQESAAIYYHMGLAISNWSRVESGLFWLATLCFTHRHHYYVAVTIFSIDAFSNKVKVVDRLIRSKYGKTSHLKKWITLERDLRRLSSMRNFLAHCRRMEYPQNQPGRRIALEPWIVGPRQKQRIPKPPSGALCLKDIVDAGKHFDTIWVSLQAFYHELKSDKTRPAKSPWRSG